MENQSTTKTEVHDVSRVNQVDKNLEKFNGFLNDFMKPIEKMDLNALVQAHSVFGPRVMLLMYKPEEAKTEAGVVLAADDRDVSYNCWATGMIVGMGNSAQTGPRFRNADGEIAREFELGQWVTVPRHQLTTHNHSIGVYDADGKFLHKKVYTLGICYDDCLLTGVGNHSFLINY